MPFINFTVEGLNEIISGLNEVMGNLQQTKQEVVGQIGEFMANEMRNNAHVITGYMKSTIQSQVLGDTAEVSVSAPYAAYENRRIGGIQGPHDFANRAYSATLNMGPQIANRAYTNLFSRL